MGTKSKGTRLERELIHMLHESGWGIIRSAGSGSTPLPSADILAGNGSRHLAIECKALKAKNKYFYPEEIEQLLSFSNRIGAEPWIGIRFNSQPWFFLQPKHIEKTKKGIFVISLESAKSRGLRFENLIKKQD